MNYATVSSRFLFFNGKERYTVEYAFGLSSWYVFKDTEIDGAIYVKKEKKIKFKNVNNENAELVLNEYLDLTNTQS